MKMCLTKGVEEWVVPHVWALQEWESHFLKSTCLSRVCVPERCTGPKSYLGHFSFVEIARRAGRWWWAARTARRLSGASSAVLRGGGARLRIFQERFSNGFSNSLSPRRERCERACTRESTCLAGRAWSRKASLARRPECLGRAASSQLRDLDDGCTVETVV